MSNLLEAAVKIKGVRPLFLHQFGEDSIPLVKRETDGVAGNVPSEWRRSVSADNKGQLYIRGDYVFSCLAGKDGGAKYTRNKRATLLAPTRATLEVSEDRIYFGRSMPGANGSYDVATAPVPDRDPDLPVYMDVRSVINPGTGARNVRYRIAMSPGWECSFHIQWDKTLISRDQMKAILIDAGRMCGIGSARAIGMGRFEVSEFTVSDS
jgi:hypothetical protein